MSNQPVTRELVAELIVNAVRRNPDTIFQGMNIAGGDAKRKYYKDFGWPEHLSFIDFYRIWERNGVASAAVSKTNTKVWQSSPYLLEPIEVVIDGEKTEGPHPETPVEEAIREHFEEIDFWGKIAEADAQAMVGGYAGVIFRIADNRRFAESVAGVSNGIEALVEVIPAWAGQLTVAEWDGDVESLTYGKPKMFQFNEANVGNKEAGSNRTFEVHPDRVHIWSKDQSVHAKSMLEPGFNDLMTLEKVSGAGGEGFWKNAKSAPIMEIEKDSNVRDLATLLDVEENKIGEALDEVVRNFNEGFDKALVTKNMKVKTLPVMLSSPEHFFNIAMQSFAASMGIPVKILIGAQTGQRASTEDSDEFARYAQARRHLIAKPNIRSVIKKLQKPNVLPSAVKLRIDWDDLTEKTLEDKVRRADSMAGVNQRMLHTRRLVFTENEIREVVGLEPLVQSDLPPTNVSADDVAGQGGVDRVLPGDREQDDGDEKENDDR